LMHICFAKNVFLDGKIFLIYIFAMKKKNTSHSQSKINDGNKRITLFFINLFSNVGSY
jgi:hypothetical protein